jgi:hypothetical protein
LDRFHSFACSVVIPWVFSFGITWSKFSRVASHPEVVAMIEQDIWVFFHWIVNFPNLW